MPLLRVSYAPREIYTSPENLHVNGLCFSHTSRFSWNVLDLTHIVSACTRPITSVIPNATTSKHTEGCLPACLELKKKARKIRRHDSSDTCRTCQICR